MNVEPVDDKPEIKKIILADPVERCKRVIDGLVNNTITTDDALESVVSIKEQKIVLREASIRLALIDRNIITAQELQTQPITEYTLNGLIELYKTLLKRVYD